MKFELDIESYTSLAIILHESAVLLKKLADLISTVDLIEWKILASKAAVLFEKVDKLISTVDYSILATAEFFFVMQNVTFDYLMLKYEF